MSPRLIRDAILIPVPLGLISAGFFIAGIPEGGILMGAAALASIWFIRPRRTEPPPDAAEEVSASTMQQSPPPGSGGGGPV